MRWSGVGVVVISLAAICVVCAQVSLAPAPKWTPGSTVGDKIAVHAIQQTTWSTIYSPSYVKLPYPNGDLPKSKGVCTDVVIRSLRSVGYDLQKLIAEDAKANPSRYPRIDKRDSNIDHRRCPNQIAYFMAYGETLAASYSRDRADSWKPGDIVYWKLPSGRDHVGVVTGAKGADGKPWVVHNLGGTAHEDCLTSWTIVGHYRFPKSKAR